MKTNKTRLGPFKWADGLLRKITRPNNSTRELEHDLAGQLTGVVERNGAGVAHTLFRQKYDLGGRVEWRFELPVPTNAATEILPDMSYDDDNRLTQAGGQAVQHDDDGNMTEGPLPAGTFGTYTFNARNQLTSAGNVSYTYDAEGNRVGLTSGGQTTRYVIDPHGGPLPRVLVREPSGGSQVFSVHAGGMLLYDEEISTGSVTYYHYDQIGSTVALTNSSGTVTDRIGYTPYGSIYSRTGTNDTPFLFVGALGVQTDPNGLHYMRARYYNSKIGRFVNADPIGFAGGLNWYAYANGNPVMYADPSGNIVETAWDLANVGIGAFSLGTNLRQGNYGWAALDAVGLAYDFTAAAVPFLPAGASAGLKALRAGNRVVDSVNAGLDVARVSDHVHDAAKTMNAGKMSGLQAARAGTKLHRQVASQTSDSLSHFDNAFMKGSNGAFGKQPDLIGSGIWADITTPGQWGRHVDDYASDFGQGIPILYQRGKGVVETTRLSAGAGFGLSALQWGGGGLIGGK